MIVEWTPTIGTPARVPVEDGLRRTTLDFDRPGERAGAREHRAHRVPVAVEVVVVSQRPLFRHGGAASAPRRRRDPGRPRSGARGAHRRLELSSGSASRRSPSVSAAACGAWGGVCATLMSRRGGVGATLMSRRGGVGATSSRRFGATRSRRWRRPLVSRARCRRIRSRRPSRG